MTLPVHNAPCDKHACTKSAKVRNRPFAGNRRSPAAVLWAAIFARRHVVNVNKGKFENTEKTPIPWRRWTWREVPAPLKMLLAMEASRAMKDHTIVAMSINLSPSLSKPHISDAKHHYIKDEVRRSVAGVLPGPSILYFYSLETSDSSQLHLHGVLTIPTQEASPETLQRLAATFRSSPITRQYRQRYDNRAVKLEVSQLIEKPDGTAREIPVNSGWALYCVKDFRYSLRYAMSPEMRRAAKEFLAVMNSLTKSDTKLGH